MSIKAVVKNFLTSSVRIQVQNNQTKSCDYRLEGSKLGLGQFFRYDIPINTNIDRCSIYHLIHALKICQRVFLISFVFPNW